MSSWGDCKRGSKVAKGSWWNQLIREQTNVLKCASGHIWEFPLPLGETPLTFKFMCMDSKDTGWSKGKIPFLRS